MKTANRNGVASSIKWHGKDYAVAVRDLNMEGLFETFCAREALDFIRREESRLPPQLFNRMMEHWTEKAAFVYSWGGPACETARYSERGVKYMAWLQLRKLDNTVTRSTIDEMAQDKVVWKHVIECVLGKLDPNSPAPPTAGQSAT
jgi:hypothetical protein